MKTNSKVIRRSRLSEDNYQGEYKETWLSNLGFFFGLIVFIIIELRNAIEK